MAMPTSTEIDAEAVRLGIDRQGVCPPRMRAQVAASLAERTNPAVGEVEDLHIIVARFDRNLIQEGVASEHVRAAAVGALVAAIVTPSNITNQ
ncbi:hypothetical protein YH66_05290 [[Brevibacterium] flavum]|uniref:Uncharacterized protein n=2 Tax=Corynebacteriaceae TaxID=1653 RepID=A0A0F6WQ99_9CORY|nr:hypothetical protein YH66_05290 [[Brevibacterium] flavum]KEI22725.1 hypothetical protein KIQ_009130 [Corynebacterium glutamicum ATCC 14067]KIH74266.1 hypothetical protein SD36_05315 [Corynebacterium glutamicum]OKX92999.1 hypothetical protein AUP71_11060 [Corynebacterium glutamicum]